MSREIVFLLVLVAVRVQLQERVRVLVRVPLPVPRLHEQFEHPYRTSRFEHCFSSNPQIIRVSED